MKKDIHPEYRPVVFRDVTADFSILTRSTRTSTQTVEWSDGATYPVIDVDVSSASHPFYTGRTRVLDTAGRVEKFRRRYGTDASSASAPTVDTEGAS
ncbi:type B 50S ribosomal protein L31 [Actinotalea sp. BY-33]|uniref:Large ribosomal subunit protein bL31B n=1 Tax=Actinotalea soli TaxID=2819234 RepID=A0A939LP66_9CELL|nr:type B 50S ribosomal protein L31 [Actinotalea soli]MBO1751806.1 type B 50S ribosomal protein L31 [Actinotalea soli]